MWPKISLNYSPNFNTIKRSHKDIKFIIIHYTGMNTEFAAINKLCNFKSKVSAHYFIKKNGSVLNLVPPLYEAWPASTMALSTRTARPPCGRQRRSTRRRSC